MARNGKTGKSCTYGTVKTSFTFETVNDVLPSLHSSIQRQTGRRQSFDTRAQTISSNSEAGRTVDTLREGTIEASVARAISKLPAHSIAEARVVLETVIRELEGG